MKQLIDRRPVTDTFARILAFVLAVLLIGIPVVLVLMAYDVLTPGDVQSATGYQDVLNDLGRLSSQHPQVTWGLMWFGIGAAAVAALALALVALIAFWRRSTDDALVLRSPGREIRVRSRAIKHLAEFVARDAGAVEPSIEVRNRGKRYRIACSFHTTEFVHIPELVEGVRERLKTVLEEQGIHVDTVQATVREPAPSEAERVRVR
jgi:hypothetical protein